MKNISCKSNELKGIHFTLKPAYKSSHSTFDFPEFSSANDCYFYALSLEEIDLHLDKIGNSWFLPFSLASAPKLWHEIGQWLMEDFNRKIKLRIGSEEFEKRSLIEIMDFLYRAIIIYESRDKN